MTARHMLRSEVMALYLERSSVPQEEIPLALALAAMPQPPCALQARPPAAKPAPVPLRAAAPAVPKPPPTPAPSAGTVPPRQTWRQRAEPVLVLAYLAVASALLAELLEWLLGGP